MGVSSPEKSYKEKLIKCVKKEVKQIMEEAVTKKFVHEDSGTITSLCGAVELCISHGLKRRALGLFKSSSTTALLHKIAKTYQPAASVAQMVVEFETCDPNKRSSSGSDSASKLATSTSNVKPALQKKNSTAVKYLWIRIALIEKQLAKIIDYIVQTSSKYYEKDALVSDPDYGSILSSLLMGPCALDFSRLRTGEHFWTDPPADELVQRHRISSACFPLPASPPVNRRPALNYKGMSTAFYTDESQVSKDYVESLHQNNKSTLLYGKNNVTVILKEIKQPLAGYLSLHQCGEILNLKWTPNQLMNGFNESQTLAEKSIYWEHAMNLVIHEIVYVHCHQDQDSDWIVLVGQDGVQYPPIHFPRGGHLLAFLSCLENGLGPFGQLDPPLWSQKEKDYLVMLGKVFPRLKRKGSRISPINTDTDSDDTSSSDSSKSTDFVFRIVYNFTKEYENIEEILDDPLWRNQVGFKVVPPTATPRSTPLHSVSTTSSTSSSRSLDQQCSLVENGEPIQTVCQSMKKQIISRAFYGWLVHCRHIKTIRTHLVGLVHQNIVNPTEPRNASEGLTEELWSELQKDGTPDIQEVYRLIYYGGMAHSLRKKLWPMILRGSLDEIDVPALRKEYEDRMSEWLSVEAIIRQRDKEQVAANIAKLSSESSTTVETEVTALASNCLQKDESNDVFEDATPSKVVSSTNGTLEKKIISKGSKKAHSPKVASPKPIINGGTPELDEERSSVSSDDSPEQQGEFYSSDILECFSINLHRIDKDVKRCDRNYWYFKDDENLDKLRNVMCTYVWEHREIGYIQGMCDLAAPLLVILDDESEAYGCFRELMKRMSLNFPSGGEAMDAHFANMRSLLQVLDNELYTLIRQNGDYTHFYFCYRWFLLDFKREFIYKDVFLVWETIWAARHMASMDFVLFLALALLNYYRDIILSNSMDFTDIIKFFNEMAERHDAKAILGIARNLVIDLQKMIEDK